MSINYNKLTWVLTKEGINQIREVLANPNSRLTLTTFKFGDANGTYYVPTGKETNIIHQCTDSNGNLVQFGTTSKSINTINMSDSNGNIITDENNIPIEYSVVNIQTLLPENSCDYEFLEVGLFGQYTDQNTNEIKEYLFAISTCSPIPKPDILDNYAISINYSASFISSNLLAIYNRIELNPDSQYVSEEDIEELSNAILYTTGNLAEQINQNTHILGLNRATQLSERIRNDEQNILINTSIVACNNLKSSVGFDNTSNYWIFRDSGIADPTGSIIDYGYKVNNITTSRTAGSLNPDIIGLAYSLNINGSNYFQIGDNTEFTFYINKAFTLLFNLNFNNLNETNTLLAQKGVFEIKKEYNSNYGIRIIMNLYDSNGNSLQCFTPYWNGLKLKDLSTIIISYNGNPSNPLVNFYINLACINCEIITDISSITENTAGIIMSTNFTEINTNSNPIASYTLTDTDVKTDFINSKVCVISRIDNIFLDKNSTISTSITLLFQSLMGQAICLNM